ncbi:MAG TPA: helix-turn-helix transcriptional regulator [Steroidobacteraceae bacterium]|nr:helix-turn-helix transcriptional regulator [Steroidobacteraceae bacterium]
MAFDQHGFDREVGLRLQRARKRARLTQAQLAARIGLPRPSYANIESGRQRIPVDVVWRAAVILDVPMATLVPEPAGRGPDSARFFPIGASVMPAASGIQWRPGRPERGDE